MSAEAYCLTQVFEPAPAAEFRMDRHYLLYAARGTMRLEAQGRRWSLPPARAALIAADTPVIITLPRRLTACSVLFSPGHIGPPPAPVSVFEMTPLARALVLECRAWGDPEGQLSDHARLVFQTLGSVTWRLSASPSPTTLPAPKSAALARAVEMTEAHLEDPPDVAELARQIGLTPRTLARRFSQEMGMSWRAVLRRLRMIRAIEQLAETPDTVAQIAYGLGYNSLSAFNAAFRDFTGQSPTDYRRSFRPDEGEDPGGP